MAINPLLLNVKPISEITTVNNPTDGHLLFYDGSDELKKVDIIEFQSLIGGIAKPLAIADATPTTAGWYKPTTSGTYANAGGLVAQKGYDTLFYFDGTTWSLITVDMPTPITNNYTIENTYNIDPDQIVPSEAMYNSGTIAGDVIKRISVHSKNELTYKEVTVNENGIAISDADLTDDRYFIKENGKYYVQILPALIDVRNLGMLPGQNCGAIFQRMINRLKDVGASFFFPAADEDYIFEQQIVFPKTVINNTPTQKPFTIKGSGSYWNGKSIGNNGRKGSCIQLAYNGNGNYLDAKIISYGLGKITIEDITFEDNSGDNTPFFYGVYTTWSVRKCAFLGSKNGLECDQDVFILGGTNESEVGDIPNGGFQGYGTIIADNYFNKIRRGIVGQNYFNGNIIQNNTFWFGCGNSNGGAIEFRSDSIQTCTGNLIIGNLVEMIYYNNFFVGEQANNNSFIANNLFDTETHTTSYYDFTDSSYNLIINGWHTDNTDLITGIKEQTVISGHQGQISHIPKIETDGIMLYANDIVSESAQMGFRDSNIKILQRYYKSTKELHILRINQDGSEEVFQIIKDYNDGYYSFILQGENPRLDSKIDKPMKLRSGIGQELFLGDLGGKGITILNGVMMLQPQADGYNNSIFIDSIDGKLKFKDSSGTVNLLY